MKGQFNIEYLVSLAIFIVILVFVSSQVAQVVPRLHSESTSNQLDAKGYRITDTLIKTNGEPDNWESSTPKSIGLAKEPYILSDAKITAFKNLCSSNYNLVRSIFGFRPGSDFEITIASGDAILMDCGQRAPANAIRSVSRRYAVNETGSVVDIIFSVW